MMLGVAVGAVLALLGLVAVLGVVSLAVNAARELVKFRRKRRN